MLLPKTIKGPQLVAIMIAMALGTTFLVGWTWAKKYSKLPEYGPVPAFSLTDSNSSNFKSEELHGKVTVINFIFTSCKGICPAMSRQMLELKKSFKARKDFAIVSISIDPEQDTPGKMLEFAKTHGENSDNWHFLTGEKDTIKSLLNQALKVGFPDHPELHSDKVVLVDQRGDIRGFYSSKDENLIFKLHRDAAKLMARI